MDKESNIFFLDEREYLYEIDFKDEKNINFIKIINECFQKKLSFVFYTYNPFDLKTIPLFANGCLFSINKRAMKILNISSFEEMNIIMQRFRDVQIETSSLTDDDDYGVWLLTDVASLVQGYIDSCIFEYEAIFLDGGSRQETKPRIFALLAIFLIGSICNAEIDINRTMSREYLAIRAMEAICTAEKYNNFFEPVEEIKSNLEEKFKQERAKKAANARHAPTNSLKEKIINNWYENSQSMSKNEFAKKISTKMNLKYETVRKWLKGVPNQKPIQINDDFYDIPF